MPLFDGRDAALIAFGAVVATGLAAIFKSSGPAKATAPPTGWLLVVKLTFTDEASAATFLHDFKPCADGVTKLEVRSCLATGKKTARVLNATC